MPNLVLPKLYAKQRAAIFNDARYAVIEASTKAGKTVGCITWILSEAWKSVQPGRNYWWIAPTFPVAKIAYRRVRRMMHRADPKKTIWSSNDSELRISFTDLNSREKDDARAEIWFKGSDDPDSLYGEDVYGAVVDEASRCKEDSWYALRSTLTATKGKVRIIGNVKGRKNWAFQMGQQAKSGEPNMSYAKLTAWDAVDGGVLDAEEIHDAKRRLPERIFNELFLAEPGDDGGNPFGIQYIAECFAPYVPGKPVVYGVDLAKSQDWTAVVGLDDNGNECFFERWQGPWRDTKRKLLQILDAPAHIDATGNGNPIVEDLQHACTNEIEGFVFSNPSKQQIMEGLATGIQSGTMRLRTELLRSELELFEYEYSKRLVKYNAPVGCHDDCVCALALAYDKWGRMARSPIPFIHAIDAEREPVSIEKDQDFGWESVG